MAQEQLPYGTGRRKEAVARVRLKPGDGKIIVNKRNAEEYFGGRYFSISYFIKEPMMVTGTVDKYDVIARVNGGGITGQAGALRLGIARALVDLNSELRPVLRKGGFLTRDPRMHERKKYGRYGRRRSFQYSKR